MFEQIIINDVSKIIKGSTVIDGISMMMERGKVYGIKGVNGSGKTMLLRLICGLIRPTKGEILYDETVLGKDILFPPSVGILLEHPSFLDGYTGYANLKMIADIQKRINEDQIKNVIRDVGLDPCEKKIYKKYSLGMKQRLGIAAAIMENPELILLDEPFNALDSNGSKIIKELVLKQKKNGATIVLTAHNEEDLIELADIIVVLEEGRCVAKYEVHKV